MKITAPNSWITTTLQEICLISMGQSPPSNTYNTKKIGLPFFQGKAEFTKLHPVASKWCSEPRVTADNNDVLISVRAPVGSVNIANSKCCIGRGLASIKYDPCHKFIYYYLITQEDYLKSQSSGSTFKAISGSIIKSLLIMLPSLPEQRAIVAKLEKLLSELDNAVASLKQAKEQIKNYRQSVLKAAFTGKLTEEWRKQQTTQTKWKETTFANIVPSMRRGPFGSSIKKSFFVEIGYKVYEQQNAIKKDHRLGSYYINEDKFIELHRFKINAGDYIVSCAGTIGELYRLPPNAPTGVINQALLRLRLDTNEVLDCYFEYYFNNPMFRKRLFKDSKGTAMKNLAEIKSLKLIPVLLPKLQEQQQIVDEIESRFIIADQLDQSIDDSLNKAIALKQGLLKQAFEGKLLSEEEVGQIREDPDWEPAEKLLERIRYNKGR